MANESDSNTEADTARRQELSALVDGELTSDGVQRVCAAWRDEPSSREAWHTYSLIGDVLRSEDLASSGLHDERFLRDLRARLRDEPVVLAPQTAPAVAVRRSGGRFWKASAAVAAGFVVVVGAMLATQQPPQADRGAVPMAAMPVSPSTNPSAEPVMPVSQVTALAPSPELNNAGTELVFDGQVIRDPRLDRYLLAHKQFSGSSVLGAPSGFLRNAAAEVPAR